MSDVFDRLKLGSAGHKARVTDHGSLILTPVGADKVSLEAFQPKAKEALQAASEGQFTIIQTHASERISSGELYDQIIISPA
jgi:hypothetical protein